MVQPIRSPENPGTTVVSIGHLIPWPENPGYCTQVWYKCSYQVANCCFLISRMSMHQIYLMTWRRWQWRWWGNPWVSRRSWSVFASSGDTSSVQIQPAPQMMMAWNRDISRQRPALRMRYMGRDYSVCAPSQWEMTLQCDSMRFKIILLPHGSLGPTGHNPYRSQGTGIGSHHWCFY